MVLLLPYLYAVCLVRWDVTAKSTRYDVGVINRLALCIMTLSLFQEILPLLRAG